ncbi:MAG: carboxypeptidase regulatory-like domain-containing protein [Acidobacteria bacterium]|nr:carboxypeptidase regulatory-like domain-containing protein [Acidobacteriota bacterium]
MLRWHKAVILSALLSSLSVLSSSQTGTTSLRGTISDPQGAIVPGAAATLSNTATGFSRSTQTDDRGFYQFLQVPPGTYSLTISKSGFAVLKDDGLQLLVDVPATVNGTLRVQAEASTVEVMGMAVQVNSEDATLGNAFGASQIAALPFEGRDPTQILSLQPSVTFVGTNVDQNQDSRGGSVSGARSDQTNITLDGVDDNDQVKGFAFEGALRSTLDSLQEFRVTTSNANADEGRSSGAQVSLVTKSGTNSFHGSAYEYNRNNIGEANDWFNKQSQLQSGLPNVPGQLIRNTFGATFGGPVVKDRVFLFLAYEGQRTRESVQTTRVVPSQNLRQGIVSYDCTGDPKCPAGGVETLTRQDLASLDPNCSHLGTCPLGPGANPAIMALFQKYPQPNSTAVGDGLNFQGFTFPASTPGKLNTYVAKFDFNLSQNQHVFVRGGLMGDNLGQGPEFPGQGQSTVLINNSKGLIFGYTNTWRPNLINNFHYGYIRQGIGNIGQLTSNYTFFGNGPDSLTANTPTITSNVPVHNIVDDLEWVKGKHTLAFGGNLRIVTNNRSSDANSFIDARSYTLWLNPTAFIAGSGGSFDPSAPQFSALGLPAVNPNFQNGYDWPVIALAGLLDSSFSNYNITKQGNALPTGQPALRHFRAHEFETYIQDTWRVTPQLTITYGMRYTLLQPPYETTGTQVSPSISLEGFLQSRGQAMLAGHGYNPPISYVLSGQANGKAPYWNWDYGNVAPRLAFAWSPKAEGTLSHRLFGASGKTAIRGGYGMYYDHFGQGIVDSFDRNGSFGLTTTIQNPIGQYTVDTSPRFIGPNLIPPQLVAAPPTGGFPKLAPQGLPLGATTAWGLDDRLKTPYSHVFDLSISRELHGSFVLDVAYVGRLGRRLLQEEDLAMPLDIVDKQSGMDYFSAATLLSKAAAANVPIQNLPKIPYWEDMFPGAAGVYDAVDFGSCTPGSASLPVNFSPTASQAMYSSYACALHNETLPLIFADVPGELGLGPNPCFPACSKLGPYAYFNPQFTSLYAWRNAGTSSYHALQVTLRHGMKHGLQWDFNYTYSKSIDIGSNAERINNVDAYYQADQIINSWSPAQLRGPSDFDTTHQFNTNWVYEVPVGRGKRFVSSSSGWLNGVVGGWQWSGLARWTSGFPTTIETFTSFPTNWYLPSTAILAGPRPETGTFIDQNGNPDLFKDPAAAQAAFRYSLPGESGQRNELRGAGFFGIDMALNKVWPIHESQALKFSWDVYNVTNSVRFDVASLPQNTGQLEQPANVFATFTQALTKPRIMEFALRYSF